MYLVAVIFGLLHAFLQDKLLRCLSLISVVQTSFIQPLPLHKCQKSQMLEILDSDFSQHS